MSRYLYGAGLAINGIRLHVVRFGGSGTPLVILPGITSPAATWSFVAERLAAAFDVYVVDYRGRGLSEQGPDMDYSLKAMAEDLIGLADHFRWESFIVLGHSMGARVGIFAAEALKNRIHKLLLIDPPVSGPGRRAYPIPLEFMLKGLHAAQSGADLEEMRPFMATWKDDLQIRIRSEWLPSCDQRAVEVAFAGFHEDDIHTPLAKIEVETMLMMAARGVIQTAEADEMQQLLPTMKVVTVDAGHMVPYENLEAFLQITDEFLGATLR